MLRVAVARCAGGVVGFALVHGLEADASWTGMLASMASTDSHIEDLVSRPGKVVVIHDLQCRVRLWGSWHCQVMTCHGAR